MKRIFLVAILLSLALPVKAQQQAPTFFVPLIGGGMVTMGGVSAPAPMTPMPVCGYPCPQFQ